MVIAEQVKHKELGATLLGMACLVQRLRGPGLLEHIYQDAMCGELKLAGIPFERERVYALNGGGGDAGAYFTIIVVDGRIVLSVKSAETFHSSVISRMENYLRMSGIEIGFLINFYNRKVEWQRFVNGRD